MPRRSKKKGPAGARVEVIEGRGYVPLAASASSFPISPSSFARALAIADVFQFYRFTKLKVIIIPGTSGVAVGYAPGAAFDVPPNTRAQILELPMAVLHGVSKTTDTVLNVGRKEMVMNDQLQWFKTIPGTPDTQWEIQGNIYWISDTATGALVVEYTVEFQSWNLAAQSPLFSTPIPAKPLSQHDESQCVTIGGVTYKRCSA